MAEKSNQIVSSKLKDWSAKMLEHLKSVLDRFMRKYPQYEELIAFMEDEKRMYDSNGMPTEEYQKLISNFNDFCSKPSNKLSIEELAKEDNLDPTKVEVLGGVKDFLDKQKELMESYRRSSDKKNWPDQVLDSKDKREAFDKIVEESTNSALANFESAKE